MPQAQPTSDARAWPSPALAGGTQNPQALAVAIATRDRADSLARLIEALLAQIRRPDEILIIDDGRLDDDRVSGWRARCQAAGVAMLYHRKEKPGRSASRNLAASLTDCPVICFMDDDAEPKPPFLDRLLAGLDSYGRWQPGERDALVAVEGLAVRPGGPRPGDRIYATVQGFSGFWRLARTRWPKKLGENLRSRPYLAGVCVAVRREALKATPFDETLSHGEDRDWSVRLSRLGRIGRVTDAVCLHHFEPSARPRAFAAGVRIARNYLHSQRKLFGLGGLLLAPATIAALAMSEAIIGLAACAALRRSGPAWLARSAGLLAGLLTPRGQRAD
jgi:GT2 family glycosyltransferase